MARHIPEWVNHMIKDQAVRRREALGSRRNPYAPEVRELMRDALLNLGDGGSVEYLPSESHIKKMLRTLTPLSDIEVDGPWSLGLSQAHYIPDDATGALMVVWRWAILDASAAPLSIRTARWVSKLRWVPEVGGSPHGEVLDPAKLYQVASVYSGRERQVELVKDKKGMRSGVLDAKLMLGAEVSLMYRRLGLLSDDEGIKHEEDLAVVAPEYMRHLHAKARFDAGMTAFNMRDGQRLAERFFVFGTPKNVALAEQIFNGAMKVLTTDPRYRTLNPPKWQALMHSMMDDFIASFQEIGNCLAWNPPIEATLVRITR